MQIETYEIEEVYSSEVATLAMDAEAIELCKSLSLDGQMSLTNAETLTRFQFSVMDRAQQFVFSHCFPQRTPLKEFRSGIIPFRVLQVAASCKDFPQTSYLEVWHTGDAQKDLLLVGKPDAYHATFYILARWGEALDSFDELRNSALVRARVTLASKIAKIKAAVAAYESTMEQRVLEASQTGSDALSPSFYE